MEQHQGRGEGAPEELPAASARVPEKPVQIEEAPIPTTRVAPIALTLVVAVLVIGTVAYVVHDRIAAQALRQAHTDFVRCLVGEPVGTFDSPSVRFHRIQLGAISTRATSDGEIAWPLRCAERATTLAKALRTAGRAPKLVELSEQLGELLKRSATMSAATDVSQPIELFFRESAEAKLDGKGESAAPAPPPAIVAANVDTLDAKHAMLGKGFSLERTFVTPFVDTTLSFVVDDPSRGEPQLCAFTPQNKALHCANVPEPAAKMSPGLRPWGTSSTGAAPFVFAGIHGRDGIFRTDTGARIVDSVPFDGAYGASAREDGSFDYLVWQDASPHMLLRHRTRDGHVSDAVALVNEQVSFPFYSTSLVWDWFAYRAVVDDEVHLFARHVDTNGKLAPVEDVGRIFSGGVVENGTSFDEIHMTACRSDTMTVIRSKGYGVQFVSMRLNGRWTAPLAASGMDGALSCDGPEAIIVTAHDLRVLQSRCNITGCTGKPVDLQSLVRTEEKPRQERDFAAVGIAGKVLLVWYAGDAGGLRTRFASADEIDAAKDSVLVDDHVKDGQFTRESTYVSFKVMNVAGGALVLAHLTTGVFPFWVDASGKPELLQQQ
jgi:hypothetical protein